MILKRMFKRFFISSRLSGPGFGVGTNVPLPSVVVFDLGEAAMCLCIDDFFRLHLIPRMLLCTSKPSGAGTGVPLPSETFGTITSEDAGAGTGVPLPFPKPGKHGKIATKGQHCFTEQ